MLTADLRARVVLEARSWLGTPYHHCARVRGAGVDCAQLLIAVYSAVGLIPPVDPKYPPDWHLHRDEERFLAGLQAFGTRLGDDTTQLRPADVVVWRYGRCYSHGAVYIGGGEIVHAYVRQGCTLGRLADTQLSKRPSQFWRPQGLV